MQKKSGKWFADWRDATGVRHRKAFATRKAALKHQTRQANAAHEKKAHASAPSPSYALRGRKLSRAGHRASTQRES